jgi:hypothetical protein
MSIWAVAFAIMSATQGVGDGHRGQWLPFWQAACRDGQPRACAYLANLESIFCGAGSGWACNEASILRDERIPSGRARPRSDIEQVAASFDRGCKLGFVAACRNAGRVSSDQRTFERAPPTLTDYAIVLRGSKGPITDRTPSALMARACEQGWPNTCG